jgi:predicted metal-dependent hydrolase
LAAVRTPLLIKDNEQLVVAGDRRAEAPMQVRYPELDFSNTVPHWCASPEQSQVINAGNIIPAYIEPFLIKVMRKAKKELDPVADAQLIADIDTFNKQEAQHMKAHNDMLTIVRNKYPNMKSIEDAYAADYARFLAEKPLEWLLAYCEGFEAFGSNAAEVWLDGRMEGSIEGADPQVVAMFRWHLAEEYEHRTVAHRAFHRLGGSGGPVRTYFRRLAGLWNAATHMLKYANQLEKFLIEADQANMSPEELRASKARHKQGKKVKAAPSFGKFIKILSPRYDPKDTPAPKNLDAVLAVYS